ncbi:MAG: hypothetical protein WBE68_06840 [Candidatus Nitrosopolaris sp.]
MSIAPNNHDTFHLTKYFLIISVFLIAISILAIYSTIAATEYGAKKDDSQVASLTHLVKSIDWFNDYEAQKLGEKVLQAQIDNLNATLQNVNSNLNNMSSPTVSGSGANKQPIYYSFSKNKSYINMLHADKSVEGSLANLKNNGEIENSTYERTLTKISEISKFITIYELVTVLLIIGAGMCGISEIAKNKLLGYPGLVIGCFGVLILLLAIVSPSTIVGSEAPID